MVRERWEECPTLNRRLSPNCHPEWHFLPEWRVWRNRHIRKNRELRGARLGRAHAGFYKVELKTERAKQ